MNDKSQVGLEFPKIVKGLIILLILANSVGLFFPVLISTFSPYYGSIAKHIATTGNWNDLVLSGNDWLDKPHFPFWITALSFKVFGINSFAYIIPGFLFNLLGAYFTYKLAKFWYDENIALVSALFTISSLHIMLSSIDVRAEAYLLGEIIPAVYFWLLYDKTSKIKYLILGAIFTALALMTKGLFTLITILSGITILWVYTGKWRNFIRLKWIVALILSIVLIFPELISLYKQFNLHPEKVIFGHSHVSGIRWFFWDSQFGRFFNNGPIMSTNPPDCHYLFFVYTLLWAYLPWWPIFIFAIYSVGRNFFKRVMPTDAEMYFLASFFVTFILFSITKFQVDHYTNILFPFASIMAAKWLLTPSANIAKTAVFYIELVLSLLFIVIMLVGANFILSGFSLWAAYILGIMALLILIKFRHKSLMIRTITYPSVAIAVAFIFAMMTNGLEYAKYDAGYQIAKYLNVNVKNQIVGYDIDLLSLDFHSQNPYTLISDLQIINKLPKPIYVVTQNLDEAEIFNKFHNKASVVKNFKGCRIETYLANLMSAESLSHKLNQYVVIKIN